MILLIYEVNLKIQVEIRDEFMKWAYVHKDEMLSLPGFVDASIYQDQEDPLKFTFQYLMDSEASLENYLENHAAAMREDGLKRFPDGFKANRRVLLRLES